MSGVFRRPHDFRVQPRNEAALFGGGSPPVVDDPPLSRNAEQERFHAASRLAWPFRPSGAGLAVALFPQAPAADDPPLSRGLAQELALAGLRPYPIPSRIYLFDPAVFPPGAAPEAPPLQGPEAQRLFWATSRPYGMPPRGPSPLPPLDENDTVFSPGVEQLLAHLARRPDTRPVAPFLLPPALFPAPAPDAPPLAGLGAQEAFLAALRPGWQRDVASPLHPALFPAPAPDQPPLSRHPATDAFWAAYRPYPIRGGHVLLADALYPAPDAPPIPGLAAQEAFWAGFRTPFARPGWAPLAAPLFPVVLPDSPPFGGQAGLMQARAARRDRFVLEQGLWRALSPALIEAAVVSIPTTEEEILDRLSALEAGCAELQGLITETVIADLALIKKYLKTLLSDQQRNHESLQRTLDRMKE